MSVEAHINIYNNVCDRWNSKVYAAMRIGRRDYRSMKRTVKAEIQQIKPILLEVAPFIQRIICPQLASSIANNIMFHFNRIQTDIGLRILVEERHHELRIAMFRSVLTPCL
jgi:hypothetical protein